MNHTPQTTISTRDSLEAAAWQLFADQPPAAVSTRTIAEASGCSHGMITVHFGGKPGLEQATARRVGAALEFAVHESFASEAGVPAASFIAHWRSHPRVARLLVRAGLGDLPIEPIVEVSTIGEQLVARIEALRGGTPKRPTQRSRIAAYGVLCALLGMYTFDEFMTWGTRTQMVPREIRDAASTEALLLIAATAADDTIDLRLPRAPRRERQPSDLPARPVHGRVEVRDALINAAILLFAQKGPAAVTTREIAETAGVNHGLIHRHFGSKEALLASALDVGQGRLLAASSALGEEISVPTIVRLQRRALSSRTLARLLVERVNVEEVRPSNPVLEAVLRRYPEVPAGEGPGSLRDPRLALHATGCMVAGASIWEAVARRLVGLPTADDVDVDVPLTTFAERILAVPVELR